MVQHTKMSQCNVPHHQNEGEKTQHSHLNLCRKSIWENSTPFHDKQKNRRQLPQRCKSHMWKIHNIVFNGERLKAFHLRSGRRWGYLLFTTYIQHSAGRSIRGIRQGKEKASKLEISKFIFINDDLGKAVTITHENIKTVYFLPLISSYFPNGTGVCAVPAVLYILLVCGSLVSLFIYAFVVLLNKPPSMS